MATTKTEMESSSAHHHHDLFTSLISDIKSYSGKDPLLPWLRGIKKMRESLPADMLKEKLPRFLQKCTLTFHSDRRYRNDSRYLRVWLHLMDYVDEPGALLRTMETNQIGTKRALFYQAYALFYEKIKRFDEAEKMYHLGVQSLAEPVDELQKSYEQFLHRLERHKSKKIQRLDAGNGRRSQSDRNNKVNNENTFHSMDKSKKTPDGSSQNVKPLKDFNHAQKDGSTGKSEQQVTTGRGSDEPRMLGGDDTVVVKFVDTTIVGKSEAEDACHHGLVDPTINLKEAMNDINSMFREPLEIAPVRRRSQRSQQKEDHSLKSGFGIFIDVNVDNETESSHQIEGKGNSPMQPPRAQACQPHQEPFQIYIDDEENNESADRTNDDDKAEHVNAFVFPCPKDLENSEDMDAESLPRAKIREDTVVHRFVGSTIIDEPAVENVCHHGLVDPTINLREAMNDINNMFGKPMDFVRRKRPKQQEKAPVKEQNLGGFSILPDDDLENQQDQKPPPRPSSNTERDLFEPTLFTKEAMDEINKMFGLPM